VREAEARPPLWTTWSYVGLAGTGLLAGGAAITGVLALNSSNELARTPYALGHDTNETSLRSKVLVLRTTTDVLAVGAILTLGATLYFTFHRPVAPAPQSQGALRLTNDGAEVTF
jgi:hypothetical protein